MRRASVIVFEVVLCISLSLGSMLLGYWIGTCTPGALCMVKVIRGPSPVGCHRK